MPRTLTHFEIRGGAYKLPLSQHSKRGRDAATGTWRKAHMQPEALLKKENKTPSNPWKLTQIQNSTGRSTLHDRTRSCQAPFGCLIGELETMAKPLYFLCQDVSPKVRLEVFAYNHIIYAVAMFFFKWTFCFVGIKFVLYCFVYISIPLTMAYSKYLMTSKQDTSKQECNDARKKTYSIAQGEVQLSPGSISSTICPLLNGDKQMNW